MSHNLKDLKRQARAGIIVAQCTLVEMTYKNAEWLEDTILHPGILKIGNKEKKLTLLETSTPFCSTNLNEFGYPTTDTKERNGNFQDN